MAFLRLFLTRHCAGKPVLSSLNVHCFLRLLGSLGKDVFERRTSTGSKVFSLTICLDAKKFVLLSFFSLIRTIYLRVSTKPPSNDAKRSLPVDVRRSKTLLLKLPITPDLRETARGELRAGKNANTW